MKKKGDNKQGSSQPRKRAAEKVSTISVYEKTVTGRDLRRLVHELEIHQVELKIQNEELRNAQVELAASRDRYTDLYEFAPLAYVTFDKGGRILESNLTAASMLGVERQELLRADFSKFVTSESQDDWYLHRRAAFSDETKQACEIGIRRPDGTLLSVRAESIGSGAGTDRYCRTAFVDITERKQAEELREQLLAPSSTYGTELLGSWMNGVSRSRDFGRGDYCQRTTVSWNCFLTSSGHERSWFGSPICGSAIKLLVGGQPVHLRRRRGARDGYRVVRWIDPMSRTQIDGRIFWLSRNECRFLSLYIRMPGDEPYRASCLALPSISPTLNPIPS